MTATRSRAKNSARNIFFAAMAFVLKMLLQFVVRAVFIRYFVAGYLGINGLFTNILSVLSLAELGVGNAIVYSMYKPIADNDTEKIKSLVALYKKLYLIIAGAVTVIGLSLIPALPYLIKDAPNVDINLTVIYVLFLAQNVVGYFFAYRRSLVFAYQRNDIESKVSLFAQVVMAAAQILIIVLWKNFYAYTVAAVLCHAIDALIVYLISFKLFPEIKGEAQKLEKSDIKEITKNTSALVFHKLGAAVVFSTDSIIISAFVSTTLLGYYSNYTLVTAALASIVKLFITATKSSIGNYIAEKPKEEVYRIYKALNLALMWFVGFIFIGLFVCFQDFIRLYSGKASYVLPFASMALLSLSFYLTQSRWLTNAFKECAGLFWNDRFKPLFEAGINLGLDFLFVHFWGVNGVIIATITSTVLAPLWVEPYVLYKNVFKLPIWKFFIRYAVYSLITVAAGAATFGACWFIPSGGLGWFALKFGVCLVLPNLIMLAVYFKTPEFGFFFKFAKGLFRRKRVAANLQPTEANVGEETDVNTTDIHSEHCSDTQNTNLD